MGALDQDAGTAGTRCAACGFESPGSFRFCGQCGVSLAAPAGAVAETHPAAPAAPAERRQVSVLFCDLVGSTELAEELDPEELRDLIRGYQEACERVVCELDGHIAQYLGDGILVYFGYPRGHEDDTRRAVRAGLGIIDAIAELNQRRDLSLAVRIGIHSGPVVAGEMGAGEHRESLAVGSTPNLAARLQHLAAPDTVVLSGATHELVREFFDWCPLGSHRLKGLSQPVEVYQPLAESGVHGRFEVVRRRGLHGLVDRHEEQKALAGAWRSAEQGDKGILALAGEPGVGKSRLVHLLEERAAAASCPCLIARCSPYHQNSAFHPLTEMLRHLSAFRHDDPPERMLAKLERRLRPLADLPPEAIPILATLLDLPLGDRHPPLSLSPQRLKERTLEVLLDLLARLGARSPVVLIVEDLHWIDPSTLELLELLVELEGVRGVVTLFTYRPGFEPGWQAGSGFQQLTLDPLLAADAESLVREVARGKELPAGLLEQVVEKTDGIPLFIEELTQVLLESDWGHAGPYGGPGPGGRSPITIPATLKESLTARLDRLAAVKEVVQVGAVLGREFRYDLLVAVAGREEAALGKDLDLLVERDILSPRGSTQERIYVFKHALLQEAAYELLLKSARKRFHARAADVLVERFAETADLQPEVVARHYTEAGLAEKAATYWLRAGERANRRAASLEATRHIHDGLRLLGELPASPLRDRLEVGLQLALATAQITTRGYGAPEVEVAFERAQKLQEQAGESEEQYWILMGLNLYHFVRADLERAQQLSLRLVTMAEGLGERELVAAARFQLVLNEFFRGEFPAAQAGLDEVVPLIEPDDIAYMAHSGSDIRTMPVSIGALVRWHLGFPESALRLGEQAIARAREIGHPHSLVMALIFAGAELCYYAGDVAAVRDHSRELIAICEENGYLLWGLQGRIFLAWAEATAAGDDAATGPRADELDATMVEALGGLDASGALLAIPYFCGLRAECLMRRGKLDAACQAVNAGLAGVQRTGDRFWEAELWRLTGELERKRAEDGDARGAARARQSFETALEVAREQGSRWLELRVALSLAQAPEEEEIEVACERLRHSFLAVSERPKIPDFEQARALLAAYDR